MPKRIVCSCKKGAFTSYKKAKHMANQLGDEARVYWCPEAGGYHLTRYSLSENDALHAARKKTNGR